MFLYIGRWDKKAKVGSKKDTSNLNNMWGTELWVSETCKAEGRWQENWGGSGSCSNLRKYHHHPHHSSPFTTTRQLSSP